MEKLHSDMLEMILSQPTKRLNERQTKFLIYQVRSFRYYNRIRRKSSSLGSRCFTLFTQQIDCSL